MTIPIGAIDEYRERLLIMSYKCLLLFISAILWHIITFRFAPRMRLVKPNFAGKPIMASYGIAAFPYAAALTACLYLLGYSHKNEAALYLAIMAPMWILGILDDTLGSRDVGGFKGHFKKLLLERKLTTGAAKALGGGIVGILAGWYLSHGDPIKWLTAAMLIPLAANLLNLLDLRPGRAVAVFFLGIGVICIVKLGVIASPWILGSIALVAFAFGIADSRGRAMMGDSWSNALGSALGLTIVLNTGLIFQWAAIAGIVAIHLYSEKRSVSALIERNTVLRVIDRHLGVR